MFDCLLRESCELELKCDLLTSALCGEREYIGWFVAFGVKMFVCLLCVCQSCELIEAKSYILISYSYYLPAPLVAKENTLAALLNPKAFLVDIRNSYLRKFD